MCKFLNYYTHTVFKIRLMRNLANMYRIIFSYKENSKIFVLKKYICKLLNTCHTFYYQRHFINSTDLKHLYTFNMYANDEQTKD